MKIAAALREWDHWCLATRRASWRVSKHANVPDRDRIVAVQLADSVAAGAQRLGCTSTVLMREILANRRDGFDYEVAVVSAVETIKGRINPR